MSIENIMTICPNPGCDRDIVLDAAKIKRAIMRKPITLGKPMIGCPVCGFVMILPDKISTEELFEQYLGEVKAEASPDALECVPMLDPTQTKLPTGSVIQAGTLLYRPGGGTGLYDKYAYMVKFGIDPSVVMFDSGKKPFAVGDKK